MKKGFTLAEVLITLSVIAVVALMTIPSIIKNYRYKLFAATLKQTVSQLEDAIKSSMADEHATTFVQSTGGLSNNCTTGHETGPCYLFAKYLKTTLTCSGSSDVRCMAANYKSLKGDATRPMWGAHRCGKLPNGATVCMVYNDFGMNSITHVAIDVNGPDYPNIIGVDLFSVRISPSGQIVDGNDNKDNCGVNTSSNNHVLDYASGCFTKVLENNWTITDK